MNLYERHNTKLPTLRLFLNLILVSEVLLYVFYVIELNRVTWNYLFYVIKTQCVKKNNVYCIYTVVIQYDDFIKILIEEGMEGTRSRGRPSISCFNQMKKVEATQY